MAASAHDHLAKGRPQKEIGGSVHQPQVALGGSILFQSQNEMAKAVIDRVPCVEMVRFVNSGTEACLSVLRLMRAFTGREKVGDTCSTAVSHRSVAIVLTINATMLHALFVRMVAIPDSPSVLTHAPVLCGFRQDAAHACQSRALSVRSYFCCSSSSSRGATTGTRTPSWCRRAAACSRSACPTPPAFPSRPPVSLHQEAKTTPATWTTAT